MNIYFDDSMVQDINGQEYFYLSGDKICCRKDDRKRVKKYFHQNDDLKKIYEVFANPEKNLVTNKSFTAHGLDNLLKRIDVIGKKLEKSNSKWGIISKMIVVICNSIFSRLGYQKLEYNEYNTNHFSYTKSSIVRLAEKKREQRIGKPVPPVKTGAPSDSAQTAPIVQDSVPKPVPPVKTDVPAASAQTAPIVQDASVPKPVPPVKTDVPAASVRTDPIVRDTQPKPVSQPYVLDAFAQTAAIAQDASKPEIVKEDYQAQLSVISSMRKGEEEIYFQVSNKDFAEQALFHIGKGSYTTESPGFISNNYPQWPPYLLNDFKVLFTNWCHENSTKFDFLKKIATENYRKGELTMNCWQFVLLIMYEKKLITVEDIENLYSYQAWKNLNRWVDLWRHLAKSSPELGDIVLFYSCSNLWHVAIVTSTSPLKITEILHQPVSTRNIDSLENLAFVNLHKAVDVIKKLQRVPDQQKRWQSSWNEEEISSLLRINIFADEIEKELEHRYALWRESKPETDEQLLSLLDPSTLYYNFGCLEEKGKVIEYHLKRAYENQNYHKVGDFILAKNGL